MAGADPVFGATDMLDWRRLRITRLARDVPVSRIGRDFAFEAMASHDLNPFHPPHVYGFLLGIGQFRAEVECFDAGLVGSEEAFSQFVAAEKAVEASALVLEMAVTPFIPKQALADGLSKRSPNPRPISLASWMDMVPLLRGLLVWLREGGDSERELFESRRMVAEHSLARPDDQLREAAFSMIQGCCCVAALALMREREVGIDGVINRSLFASLGYHFDLIPELALTAASEET